MLRSDGSVVNADAENLLAADAVFEIRNFGFNDLVEDIYVVINHRNHLDALSANKAETTGSNIFVYDFTIAQRASAAGAASLKLEIWTLPAGDYNGDGDVNPNDRSTQDREFNREGYLLGDMDLDANINRDDQNILSDSFGRAQGFRH